MALTLIPTLFVNHVIPGVKHVRKKKSAQVANQIQNIHIYKTIIALKLALAPSVLSISFARAAMPLNS